jgi:hypothetical protein
MGVQAIYNTYLSQLSFEERLELIRLLAGEPTVSVAPSTPHVPLYDVMDFAGVGQNYLMEEDAQYHVDQLREEWE